MKFEELDTIDSNELYKEKAMRLDDIESKKYIDYYNDERYKRYGYEGILPAEYSYEYHLIKKIGGMLQIEHKQIINAKMFIRKELNIE